MKTQNLAMFMLHLINRGYTVKMDGNRYRAFKKGLNMLLIDGWNGVDDWHICRVSNYSKSMKIIVQPRDIKVIREPDIIEI